MIKIIDLESDRNFLVKAAKERYLSRGLHYGWKANVNLSDDQGHWNQQIFKSSINFPYDQLKNPAIENHKEIKNLFEIVKENIGDRALLRAYINGYTYGTDGYSHRDDPWILNKYGSGALSETVIIYLNDKWNLDWCGETVIFNDENEIEKSILPKFARMLIFDSNKLHAARPLSRLCKNLRSVLVLKTIDRKIESKEVNFLLEKTKGKNHSGKSFFQHLWNTMLLLEGRKLKKEVCAAGLFHSVYDTEFYKLNDESITRDIVIDLIGEYSEKLVYEFCTTTNRFNTFLNNTKQYDDRFLHDIISIEIANLTEQNSNERYTNQILSLKSKIQNK